MSVTLLKLSCPDRVGLLARITQFVAKQRGNLLEVHQYTDALNGWFFTRVAIEAKTLRLSTPALRNAFAPLARELRADWVIRDPSETPRVAILTSKIGHCLADLLWQARSQELRMVIPLVISNHETFRDMVEREGIPFHHVPLTSANKTAAFARMRQLLRAAKVDLVVLARYMQIVPNSLCTEYAGRMINIHHSFLPSFVGANPYQRAFERGVKLIGATCHYVTPTLDEGPIVEQEVMRVEHFHTPEDMLRIGRDCERLALTRGVRYHLADRTLIHGKKVIVFRD